MTTTTPQTSAPLPSEEVSPPEQIAQPQENLKHRPQTGSRSIWSSIRLKATVLAVAIGILPVIAVGATAYYFANQSISKQTAQAKKVRAVGLTDKVNRFMFERHADIQNLAHLPIFVNSQLWKTTTVKEKQEALELFLKDSKFYDSVAVFDLNGDPIVQTSGKRLKNHKDRIYFQEVLKTDRPYISQPLISTTEGTFNIYSAAPIKDEATGKTFAVIRIRMPVKFLEEAIANFGTDGDQFYLVNAAKEVFIGPEGIYATKVNTTGKTATNSEPEHKAISAASVFPIFEQLSAANQPETTISTNKDINAEQLLAFAPTQKLEGLPDLNWSAVIAINTDLAFAPQRQLLETLFLGTGIAALLVGAIAVYTARRATRPLINASRAVERIGRGEMDTRVAIEGEDEIALLGTNINQMTDRLKTLLGEARDTSKQIEQQNMLLEESNALQEDVGQILDVVSAMEEGDLTIEAEVSDRATGLVSDTLNRLIEELAQIMAAVLSTTQQVTQSADDLKQLAATAAQQVEQQTQSVGQVQDLMTNVNDLSQDTAQQALVSDEAVQQARTAVNQGQQETIAMAKGISALQQGTEQIVKRTQTLTEFVASAAQFAKDQKRVAALTRVLALNASMIAARASAQQDPEQFASVASEFDTIATQVNDLAVQTNQSLILLQQQTDRIQTVVSGVSQDVREIGSSVNQFTANVDRSRQVFDNIQTATERVAEVGQQVTQSSQAIATAVQTTLESIQNIAAVATEAERQSTFTRKQAESIDNLARVLLEKVRFFRLPSALLDSEPVTAALPPSATNGHSTSPAIADSARDISPAARRV